MKFLLTIFVAGVVGFLGSILGGQFPGLNSDEADLGAFNPSGGLTYRLQSSIGTTNTSIRLSSFKNRSNIPLTMSLLNTDIAYGTLSPQTDRSEFVSFSGITQNSDGTATLTGVTRGLSDIYPFAASSTLREAHPGQSVFILSDSPSLFSEYTKVRTDESITGIWSFNTPPIINDGNATATNQVASRDYVLNTAIQGAATSTFANQGISELAIQSELCNGTASSTPGNPLVIANYFASSSPTTPAAARGCRVIVSGSDGYISGNWFNHINLIGNLEVDGTLFATTTKLGGTTLTWPSSNTASNTMPVKDSSGNIYWIGSENVGGWQMIASTTLTSAANSIDLQNIPQRQLLKVVIDHAQTSAPSGIYLRFNNDSGNNYAYAITGNGTNEASSTLTHAVGLLKHGSEDNASSMIEFTISNTGTRKKLFEFNGVAVQDTNAIYHHVGGGYWNNTSAQINRITILNTVGSVTFPAGSRITVYGSNQ